jgi:hypothetical protein
MLSVSICNCTSSTHYNVIYSANTVKEAGQTDDLSKLNLEAPVTTSIYSLKHAFEEEPTSDCSGVLEMVETHT